LFLLLPLLLLLLLFRGGGVVVVANTSFMLHFSPILALSAFPMAPSAPVINVMLTHAFGSQAPCASSSFARLISSFLCKCRREFNALLKTSDDRLFTQLDILPKSSVMHSPFVTRSSAQKKKEVHVCPRILTV